MPKHIHGLGSLQSEVMEIIWRQEEASVAQMVEAIGKKRPVTYTTVLSAVQKLQRKGWLKFRAAGRAYIYSAKRNREEVGGRTLRDLLRTAFGGNPKLLLASLLEDARLSDEDLTELKKLIEQRRKGVRHE